jgi:RNA polymerase sigma-70 factor (ECF subfamily)
MIYLLFNEGYAASGGEAHVRLPLCEEAIRPARPLPRLFPGEPEIMGLTALLLLQHARAAGRLDHHGDIILLEHQDRRLWNREKIAEGQAGGQDAAPQQAWTQPGAGRHCGGARTGGAAGRY